MANLANIGNFMATDPNWIQGLANMRGENPQEAMYKAQEMSVRNAALEDAAAQRATEAARRNALAQSGGQISDELISTMMQIDPEYGTTLLDAKRKQDALQAKQDFMSNYFGGGAAESSSTEGRDPSALVAAGVAYGDPTLMQLGTFEQQRADKSLQRSDELAKEARQREAELAKEERKLSEEANAEKRKASIEGFDLSEGAVPTSAIVTEATKKSTLIPRYERAKKNVMDVLEKHGDSELFTPAQAKEVKQAFSDLRNLEREVGNTGVLNVGELPFLEENYAPFNPLEAGNRLVSKEELKASAEDFFSNRKQLIKDEMGALGYKHKEETPPKTTQPSRDEAIAELRRRGVIQ